MVVHVEAAGIHLLAVVDNLLCERSGIVLDEMDVRYIHHLSSACGRSFVCLVFGLCLLAGSKTKHTELLPQEDEIQCRELGGINYDIISFCSTKIEQTRF